MGALNSIDSIVAIGSTASAVAIILVIFLSARSRYIIIERSLATYGSFKTRNKSIIGLFSCSTRSLNKCPRSTERLIRASILVACSKLGITEPLTYLHKTDSGRPVNSYRSLYEREGLINLKTSDASSLNFILSALLLP